MTLKEAIARCEKIVKEAKKSYEVPVADGIMAEVGMELTKKGIEEYQQYAEWLKELQERRKQPIIRCKDCKHANIYPLGIGRAVSCSCKCGLKDAFVSSYCSYAERRADGQ